uniref:Odorant receptor n=1 Tax=Aulacocentrum confusum TaxID=2767324 RepID=A0A7G8Z970_9HYME|nr:olfactory receptor 51 [Aulacocentrum confusum]
MRLAKYGFILLKLTGVWRPLTWQSWKGFFYNCFTLTVLMVIFMTSLSQVIYILKYIADIKTIISGGLVELAIANALIKGITVVFKRNRILELNEILQSEICTPRDNDELFIQKQVENSVKSYCLFYIIICEICIIIATIVSIFLDIPQRKLVYNAWLPYNWQSGIAYCITFILQHFTLSFAALMDTGHDCLLADCVLQVRAQIGILKCRMKKYHLHWKKLAIRENDQINENHFSEHVKHHLCIVDFAEQVNDTFLYSIFLQFVVSSSVICADIYALTSEPLFSTGFLTVVFFSTIFIVQTFGYCFIGDIVFHESGSIYSSIYQLDWTSLSPTLQKNLLLMMCRTSRPIQFSSGHLAVLSLDSFVAIMKLSYSAYNLLKSKS